MARILIVEDDTDINNLLHDLLIPYHEVVQTYAGTEAKRMLETASFDVILMDLMLPGMSGEALIELIRRQTDVPVIVITAKGDVAVLVDVFAKGADDYIAKPFHNAEVLARINAQLKRRDLLHDSEIIDLGFLVLDDMQRRVYVNHNEITLTHKEFDILRLFMKNRSKVLTKAMIYEQIWQESYYGDDNTITVHVSRLRSKIKEAGNVDIIETVWGIGFRLMI